MPRFAQAALALVSALLALVVTGCGGSPGKHVERGGPLACGDCQSDASMPMGVGELGTFDAATLQNSGKRPAVLERVAYLHRSPGLLLLGPLVARNSHVGLIREFPPRHFVGKVDLLPGYQVPPYRRIADDVEILVGVSPLRNGDLSYNGLELYYRVGSRHYVTTFDEGLRVCAPRSVPESRCPTPTSIK